MEGELISVIVPVYKVEKYLHKCVDSIINQTYKNLEIILVDDGSPDNCPTICDEYAKKDSRIKVIHKENAGVSSARNVALDVAKGEYIGFVDSDDYINLRMYEILYSNLINSKADISVIAFQDVYEEKYQSGERKSDSEITIQIVDDRDEIQNILYGKVVHSQVCNKLFRKYLFSNDVRFPAGKLYEDEATTYRLFERSNRIVISDEKLYYYLQRAGSTVHTTSIKARNDICEARIDKYNYIYREKGHQSTDESVKLTLETLIYNYPLLTPEYKAKAKELFNIIGKYKNVKNSSMKIKCRYVLFKISKRLYVLIFKILKR